MTIDLSPGRPFPDVEPADHGGNRRRLLQLTGGDPTVVERCGSANPWPWDRFDLGGGS